jgi:hypothetical protein
MTDVPPSAPPPLITSDMRRNINSYSQLSSKDEKKEYLRSLLDRGFTENDILGSILVNEEGLYNDIITNIRDIAPSRQVYEIGGGRRRRRKTRRGKSRRRRTRR